MKIEKRLRWRSVLAFKMVVLFAWAWLSITSIQPAIAIDSRDSFMAQCMSKQACRNQMGNLAGDIMDNTGGTVVTTVSRGGVATVVDSAPVNGAAGMVNMPGGPTGPHIAGSLGGGLVTTAMICALLRVFDRSGKDLCSSPPDEPVHPPGDNPNCHGLRFMSLQNGNFVTEDFANGYSWGGEATHAPGWFRLNKGGSTDWWWADPGSLSHVPSPACPPVDSDEPPPWDNLTQNQQNDFITFIFNTNNTNNYGPGESPPFIFIVPVFAPVFAPTFKPVISPDIHINPPKFPIDWDSDGDTEPDSTDPDDDNDGTDDEEDSDTNNCIGCKINVKVTGGPKFIVRNATNNTFKLTTEFEFNYNSNNNNTNEDDGEELPPPDDDFDGDGIPDTEDDDLDGDNIIDEEDEDDDNDGIDDEEDEDDNSDGTDDDKDKDEPENNDETCPDCPKPNLRKENPLTYLMIKMADKFPFDTIGDLSSLPDSSACPNVEVYGNQYEFCYVNDILGKGKYGIWVVYTFNLLKGI